MGNADDEIDRAARKHRAHRAAKVAGDAKEAASRAADERGDPAALLRKSLAQRTGFDPLFAVAFVFGLGAPLLVAARFFDPSRTPVLIGTALVSGPLIWFTISGLQRLLAARTVRRLRRVSGLDVDHYLGLLSKQWYQAKLVVQLRFDKHWADDRHAATIAATRAAVPSLETVRFDHGRALYLSANVATTDSVMSKGTVTRFFTNRAVHECFTAILDDVVAVIADTDHIAKIDVDIDGQLGTKA